MNETATLKIPVGSPLHFCRGCGAYVYLVATGRRGKTPVDPDGSVHMCRRVVALEEKP